jgi:ankyrin repeat protein
MVFVGQDDEEELHRRLVHAIRHEQPTLTVIREIVGANNGLLLKRDGHGRVPLHDAVANASFDVVEFLVERGPETLLVQDKNGWLPLHCSAFLNSPLEVVQCLAGNSPEAPLVKTAKGTLPHGARRRRLSASLPTCAPMPSR